MKPNVFVSSTCFDLSQVRVDLESMILNIGFNPILSEKDSFPVNPSESLIENCINNVTNNADIFILVIGSRYGSKLDSGKSVTNIEYETARKIGIPIFVFIKSEILNYLDVWKSNPNADFSRQVDSNEIFDFVKSIREEDKIWSFNFSTAQDISSTFITQMSYRIKELLKLDRELQNSENIFLWEHISAKAKKVLLFEEDFFELKYFQQLLFDEQEKLKRLKLHYDYNILSTCNSHFENRQEVYPWFNAQIKSLQNYMDTLRKLFHELFPKYFYAIGQPIDKTGLLMVSESYGNVLDEMLHWALRVRNISGEKSVQSLLETFSYYIKDLISVSWEFPVIIGEKIEEYEKRISEGEKDLTMEIVLTYSIDKDTVKDFKRKIAELEF